MRGMTINREDDYERITINRPANNRDYDFPDDIIHCSSYFDAREIDNDSQFVNKCKLCKLKFKSIS